ncbi:hypothetical protein GLOIN_2v506671 [Rhizophagus irregularis DAOM 181602=DAOM 197198]|uniref:Uncharacterized protein n=1 Tax=Rhizophagus irregularis (strain DAOM 181602 / DAOM 197198 / MUCL 43194) TaxID=747089 RepID=A0A2P4PF12_RHIID|nr:hypothetical protein GLOIN_2v506671 [Rhizophagus irregularis DAOM 181602=DAOM 197198]POG63978.1 hypothetical protein GLOIN_2v506671 [Rhizophagus irregularis DAOM 181602=DAOM 197198]|eukprot:XP_025170844.1 hypothetical protein GLOIN_2v506671 [Rhizophagus irregularis DAOM 181602=DAOM 197198]
MSKTKDKCKNCADFDAKLEFIIFIIFILFFISALLLKVSETMPPGEPGGPSPPVILGGIIRTNGSGLSLKISIFLILIARRTHIVRYRRKFKQKTYDQVEILEISDTNNTNEDFCSTLKNDKKRVKIGNTSICKKVTKPGIV